MSQDDIIKLLEKKKTPLTSRELAEYLEIRQETIIKTLKKLLKHNEVQSRKPTPQEIIDKGWSHHINSRFRLFFIDLTG